MNDVILLEINKENLEKCLNDFPGFKKIFL